jgi:hypothetical protein
LQDNRFAILWGVSGDIETYTQTHTERRTALLVERILEPMAAFVSVTVSLRRGKEEVILISTEIVVPSLMARILAKGNMSCHCYDVDDHL